MFGERPKKTANTAKLGGAGEGTPCRTVPSERRSRMNSASRTLIDRRNRTRPGSGTGWFQVRYREQPEQLELDVFTSAADGKRECSSPDPGAPFVGGDGEHDDEWIHRDSRKPAQFTGIQPHHFAEAETSGGRDRRNERTEYQFRPCLSEIVPHGISRPGTAPLLGSRKETGVTVR